MEINRQRLAKFFKKRFFRLLANVLVFFIFFLVILMLMSKFSFFGVKVLSVQSGSMSPAIYTGSVIFTSPASEYSEGDIITFRSQGQIEYVTHRIVSVDQTTTENLFWTKGDANDAPDSYKVPKIGIAGKVRLSIPLLGYLLEFMKKPFGLIILIVIPGTIIIYEEIKKIKKQWRKLKREKAKQQIVMANNNSASAEQKNISTKEKIITVLTKHRKLFVFLFSLVIGVAMTHQAFAATKTSGDLTITYPADPLFNETNIAPGYVTSKNITVINNNLIEEKTVGVNFFSTTPSILDDAILFTINRNSEKIYGPKTLNELITAGEISLSTIPSNQAIDFNITAELSADVDNSFQNKTSVFNFGIGFFQTETPPSTNTNTELNTPISLGPTTNTNTGRVLGEETTRETQSPIGKILGDYVTLPLTGLRIPFIYIIAPLLVMLVFATIVRPFRQKTQRRQK